MHDMLRRYQIQVLRDAGHTHEEIAGLSRVPERTVRRIAKGSRVIHVDNKTEREARKIGRPSKVGAQRSFVTDLMAKEPDLLSVEILRRARMSGYDGGKSALYELIASVRPPRAEFTTRFEGLPGEFSQHDFGQVDVRFMDDTKMRIHFFSSRLKYSRWVCVTRVPDETIESLVRPLVDHFEAMGGVPLVGVFDRPKTVAISWGKNGEVTEWNQTFAYVALELGLGVEVCWPYRAQQKGSVENLVGWVKGSFFKQRRFLDIADLDRQLIEWQGEVNTRIPSRATGVTPQARMAEEKIRLRPLKVKPETLALRIPVRVGPTAVVIHDTHLYSMPPESAGYPGTLFLYRDRVRIVAGRFNATHPRLTEPRASSTLPEHRAAHLAALSGLRGKRYLKRQHLLDVGPSAMEYLTEVVHRKPNEWIRDVDRLHDLLQAHGAGALSAAFRKAVAERTFGAEYVAHYLGHADVGRLWPRPSIPDLPLFDHPDEASSPAPARSGAGETPAVSNVWNPQRIARSVTERSEGAILARSQS
jgi:transposase